MPERRETYTLIDPVTFDGSTYTQITMRTPRGKDLRQMGEYVTPEDKAFAMLAALSGVPIGVFDEMLQPDIDALADLLTKMKAKVPTKLKTSSDGSHIVSISNQAKSTA
jgi:hypothetical protein